MPLKQAVAIALAGLWILTGLAKAEETLKFPAEGVPYADARMQLLRQGARIAPRQTKNKSLAEPDPEFDELDCPFDLDDVKACRALFLYRQSNGWQAYVVVYVDAVDKTVLQARYPSVVEALLSLPPPFPKNVPRVRGRYLEAREKLTKLAFDPVEVNPDQKICSDEKRQKCISVPEAQCPVDIPVCIAYWQDRNGRALRVHIKGEVDPTIEYMEWITQAELNNAR